MFGMHIEVFPIPMWLREGGGGGGGRGGGGVSVSVIVVVLIDKSMRI